MSDIPSELKYTKSHEWVRLEDDSIATVGISDAAQALLGDLVFVELPDLDDERQVGEDIAVVESVKAASDVYSPLSGVVVAVNEQLADNPELINTDPYGEGWIFKLKLNEGNQIADLLDAEKYTEQLEQED